MPEFLSMDFRDFDAFRACLQGWDTDPVQLGAGPLHIRWRELHLGSIGIASLEVNRRVADVSAVDPGTAVFVVSLRPHVWCGQQVPRGSLVVQAPGRDQRSSLPEGFRTLEIRMPQEFVDEVGLLGRPLDAREFPPERSVVPLEPAVVSRFEQLWNRIAESGGAVLSETAARRLECTVIDLLARALRRGHWVEAPRVPRYGLTLAALRMVDGHGEERLRAGELAAALHVTSRALEYAFHSTLGVSPARYLLSLRLNRARRVLISRGGQSVTSVASSLGFENLGRFAGQYRRLFGELPSETRAAGPTSGSRVRTS